MAEQASIKVVTETKEALTFNVDYNDVTAVDPPTGAVFCTQAAITQFLTRSGTTKFKHLNAVFESLPDTIKYAVTINLAAGIHRPRPVEPPDFAWCLSHRNFRVVDSGYSPLITVKGPLPSAWTPFDPSLVNLSITASSAPNTQDPWVDVSGTPFTGFDLKGSFVIFDTGQAMLIHKHTNSRLYVMQDASPTPTSIAKIARPSAIYRNSLDDVTMLHSVFGNMSVSSFASLGYLQLQDLTIQPCGAYNFSMQTGLGWYLRVVYDQRAPFPGFTNCINASLGGVCYFESSSILGGPAGLGLWAAGSESYVVLIDSYVSGPSYGLWGTVTGQIGLDSSVIDDCGVGCLMSEAAYLFAYDYLSKKLNEIRASRAVGLHLDSQSFTRVDEQPTLLFTNHVGVPAVRLGAGVRLIQNGTSYYGNGLKNGGGNTDVGIEMIGPGASAVLDSVNNVSGTLGDVRMKGGDIVSYANLLANGPYTDLGLNVVEKVS